MNLLLIELLHLSVWLLILCAVFVPLETLAGIRRQKFFRVQFWLDLGYYVLNAVLIGMLLGAPLVFVGALVHRAIPSAVLYHIAILPAGVRLALALVVGEIGFYWAHRLTHQVHWLWRFHSIHHSATQVDFLTNTRAHPVDMAFTRACGFIPVLALGLTGGSSTIALLLLVFGTLWGFFIHANVKLRFGPLEHIIATPFFHRWHHTGDRRRDGNYAAMFSFVDHLFGTYIAPADWPERYGIEEQMPPSLGGQLIMPFLRGSPRVRGAPSVSPSLPKSNSRR